MLTLFNAHTAFFCIKTTVFSPSFDIIFTYPTGRIELNVGTMAQSTHHPFLYTHMVPANQKSLVCALIRRANRFALLLSLRLLSGFQEAPISDLCVMTSSSKEEENRRQAQDWYDNRKTHILVTGVY